MWLILTNSHDKYIYIYIYIYLQFLKIIDKYEEKKLNIRKR